MREGGKWELFGLPAGELPGVNWVVEQWVYAHSWEAAALDAPSRAAVSYRHEHAGVLQRVKARGQAGVISEVRLAGTWE